MGRSGDVIRETAASFDGLTGESAEIRDPGTVRSATESDYINSRLTLNAASDIVHPEGLFTAGRHEGRTLLPRPRPVWRRREVEARLPRDCTRRLKIIQTDKEGRSIVVAAILAFLLICKVPGNSLFLSFTRDIFNIISEATSDPQQQGGISQDTGDEGAAPSRTRRYSW